VKRVLLILGEIATFAVLPLWGLVFNLVLPDCRTDPCGSLWRPIAVPHIFGIYRCTAWRRSRT
jgi:hypothetical protein